MTVTDRMSEIPIILKLSCPIIAQKIAGAIIITFAYLFHAKQIFENFSNRQSIFKASSAAIMRYSVYTDGRIKKAESRIQEFITKRLII